jgi:hypothetical protein
MHLLLPVVYKVYDNCCEVYSWKRRCFFKMEGNADADPRRKWGLLEPVL